MKHSRSRCYKYNTFLQAIFDDYQAREACDLLK